MICLRKLAAKIFSYLKKKRSADFPESRLFQVNGQDISNFPLIFSASSSKGWFNDVDLSFGATLKQEDVFQWSNVVDEAGMKSLCSLTTLKNEKREKTSFEPLSLEKACALWQEFMIAAKIPRGWKNAGLYHACFDLDYNHWTTPDWPWINSALIPWLCDIKMTDEAGRLSEQLLSLQLPNGGWMVRSGQKNGKIFEIAAPNDSAYLCDHGLLTWYEQSGDEKYLQSALHCADWIMGEASNNYLPYFGYDLRQKQWMTYANIVDIGFTAGLFCHLFRLLHREEHLDFARKFLHAYVKAFYRGNGGFATALDTIGKQRGTGLFMRGQAWALEGLLPYCELCEDAELKNVAMDTVRNIIKIQRYNGGWLHQWRPGIFSLLSGDDCKGIPVIAASLNRSKNIMPLDEHPNIDSAVKHAIDWCVRHTAANGPGRGGVFSWNPEGAFGVHNNIAAACIYSNAYLCSLVQNTGFGLRKEKV